MSRDAQLNLPLSSYQLRPSLYRALLQVRCCLDAPELTLADAERLNDLVAPLLLAVPEINLTAAERARLGGVTFLESAALCWHTGRALLRDAVTFAGAAPVGESLQLRAQRALALRGVSAVLTMLARRLEDLALLDLASATRDATEIHRAVEVDAAAPAFSAHSRLPLARLSAARRLITGLRGRSPARRRRARE